MKNNRVIFAALVILSGLLMVFVPGRITAVIFYSPLAAALISILSALFSFAGVSLENQLNTPAVVRGEKGELELCIKNRFPLSAAYLNPVFSEQAEGGDKRRMIFAAPFSRRFSFKYQLTYRHCGIFETGITAVRVSDILGLITLEKPVNGCFTISVLPKNFDTDGLPSGIYSQSQSSAPIRTKSRNAEDISGVRDYESRDSIKQIHWKLSMKQQKLLSKEYEEEKRRQVRVIVSFGKEKTGTDAFDRTADCALSLLSFLLARSCAVSLYCGGLYDIANQEDIGRAAHILCRGADNGIPETDKLSGSGEWTSLIISPRSDSSLTDQTAKLSSIGRVIFVSASEKLFEDEKENLIRRGLHIESFYSELKNNRLIFKGPGKAG